MIKRAFDIGAALTGLIVLAPVMALVALLVATRLGRPVLYRQQRAGLHGRPFLILKFRSMRDAIDPDSGRPLPDEERLTAFGKVLRASSLDELPSLWNVVRGEMSVVGPRPLLMDYLPRYSTEQARRHEVRPGVTGWAQINGRNAISWDQKFRLDVWYVKNRTCWLDIRIIFLTIGAVLGRRGISAGDHVTMPAFNVQTQDGETSNTESSRRGTA